MPNTTPKGEYSFSTCWNIGRHSRGEDMIREIMELGFTRVELNYNVTEGMMKTILPMIDRGEVTVSSVHNVFPRVGDPDYGTDSLLLGFDDREKRKRSIRLLIRTVEHAHRVGAKAVVVHPGEVPFPGNIDAELKHLYRECGKDSPEYAERWQSMLNRRNELAPRYLRRIERSLEEVSDYILRKNLDVKIGLETRSRCYQIPTLREAWQITEHLAGAPVGLWYDFGHGMMMERMGLYDNKSEMQPLLSRIVGVHIHETVELSDHWCPYVNSGDSASFDIFLKAIAAAPIKVYELKAACTPDEIEKSHCMILSRLRRKSPS